MMADKKFDWRAYSAWGKELALTGQVQKPPVGTGPSKPVSEFYRCTHCHNFAREDATLLEQNPEARVAWIDSQAGKTKSDAPLWLAPGTTFWGAVNRETFYNDSYEIYHFLKTANDKEMDAKSLEDSIQICCRYCSVGRFAETWEVNSLLAYFWDNEIKLSDLELPANVESAVLATLSEPDKSPAELVKATRAFVRRQYLLKAGDSFTAEPEKPMPEKAATEKPGPGETGPYPDKAAYKGDPAIGKRFYSLACDRCHGKDKPNELQGSTLIRDLRKYHKILSHGTAHDDQPYMPMFTSQRLSRQQIADIQAYLQAVAKGTGP